MESVNSVKLVIVIFLIQALWCGLSESQPCSSAFGSDHFIFRVPREHLQKGTRIGTIVFNDCSGRTHNDFMSTDTQYHVDSDGTIKLKRQVTLHNGHKMFSVHAWDSKGKKHSALVRVEHQDRADNQHSQQEYVNTIKSPLTESSSVLTLEFPKFSGGLRRRKREWAIPPVKILEQARGAFPKQMVQIKSSHAKETKMVYSLTGEGADKPPVGLFAIDRNTGWLYVSKPLDREEKDTYELQAHAHSTTDHIKEPAMEFIVEVLDINDNRPVFTQNPFIGSVPEASKIGSEFMTIIATDADDPNTYNADVRYSIISQIPIEPNPNMFAINPVTGAIRVNADGLDREKYAEYTLEIQAADMQGDGHRVTGRAIITVTDVSDKSLTKVEWVIPSVKILEHERGTFPKQMVQIKSSHAKETKMVYSLTGEGADKPPVGLFTIDRNTGWLYVSKPLDREEKDTYELQAHAHSTTDHITEPAMEIIVEVLDINDNTPVFTQNPFIGSVLEASKRGFEFMTITATDADDPNTYNADVKYSIISQIPIEPNPNMFAINPVTGAIRVNADGLDREKYAEYTLEIQAADMQGDGRRVTGRAIITVTDVSDKSLTKEEWVIPPVKILEHERGAFPKQMVQIKSSHAKQTKMVYSLTGEGADKPPVGLFTIDSNTGWLYVSKPLDREEKDKYELQAHAHSTTDHITEPAMEIIVEVLDINDNTPVFTQNPFIGSVLEASKRGFEFMTITATDADDPNTYNADVKYSIISQIPIEPNPNMFAINPVTGAIRVNADGLDREKYAEYTLEIQAADMQGDGRRVTGRAIITVTDVSDKSLTKEEWVIPPVKILEHERGAFPKQMVQIKSSHAKETKMVYSLTGEGADKPPVGLFTIDSNTGWLYVSKPLDREEKDKYELQAHAHSTTDHITEPAMEIIVEVLDINDNRPVFTKNSFIGSVPEASKIGFEFMTISATDADDPNTDNTDIRYSIISQTPPEPNPNMFEINPVTGVIRVTAEGLDSKKYPKYVLKIQAADMQGNGLSSRGNAVIFVTDSKDLTLNLSPGTWEISPICFPENTRGPFPKQLAQIKSSHTKQTKMVFSITGEGADQPPVGLFIMDKDRGWLSVTKSLDREIKHEYVLQAHITGDGVNEQTTEITICVIDQNDNKPVFTHDPFSGSVPEVSKIGFEFMTISATDADDPNTENANIRYSIISQDPALPQPNMFEINPISGVIRLNAEGLDREKYPEYTLEIQAADMQGDGLQSRGKAVITVAA